MNKCKILIPIGCRSDEGLSKPIIKRLKENEMFDIKILKLSHPGEFYNTIRNIDLREHNWTPNLVFITGDRIEMTACASMAFHEHVPICHYFAGILNNPISTLDDINRHCISLWSDIQLVESKECLLNVEILFQAIGKKTNAHVVGITHMEDLEVDESLVPNEEYDLLLYNPTTLYKEWVPIDTNLRKIIRIGPNPDRKIYYNYDYENLSRPQFLGLLKNCTRFITNSSCAYYEAKPLGLKNEQIILIGDRNKNRSIPDLNLVGASNRIISILTNWWEKKNE